MSYKENNWPNCRTVEDELDQLLEKHDFWKTIRITAQMIRFKTNARKGPETKSPDR